MRELTYSDHVRSAFHEASHAVVRLRFGIPLYCIAILRAPRADGVFGYILGEPAPVEAPPPAPRPDPVAVARLRELVRAATLSERRNVRHFLAICELESYAGIGAEDAVSAGDWYGAQLVVSSCTDRRYYREALDRFGEVRPDFDTKALRRARRFADKHWGPIRVLAVELLARLERNGDEGRLTFDEARQLVASAPRERNPWREREFTRAEWAAVAEAMRAELRAENERAAQAAEGCSERRPRESRVTAS
jgi:hypothetical protein